MNKIERALLEIGVPANLLGFKYLADGIGLALEDEKYLYSTTTMLYGKIARLESTAPARVEHAMRHAIGSAFERCDRETAEKYFGNSINSRELKATNSEFVAVMVLALKDENAAAS